MAAKSEGEVAIIDYQAGNLFSVQHACITVGLHCRIISSPNEILNACALILPGVGAFGDAMNNLRTLDLIQPLKDFASSGRPFLGICLGMQLLFSESEEFGNVKGLDIVEGRVIRFPEQNEKRKKVKIPHIGWNRIYIPKYNKSWNGTILDHIKDGEFMYFVHSFYVSPQNINQILSLTNYEGIEFCSAIIKENIFATQFHPEKSAKEGIKIFRNWAAIVKKNKESWLL